MTVVGAGSRGFGASPKRPSLLQKTNEPAGNLSQVSAQPVTAHRPSALCSHTALCLYPSCPDTTHPTHCWLTQPSTCLPFPFPSQSCPTPLSPHTHTLVLAREPSFLSLGTYFSKGGSHHHYLIPGLGAFSGPVFLILLMSLQPLPGLSSTLSLGAAGVLPILPLQGRGTRGTCFFYLQMSRLTHGDQARGDSDQPQVDSALALSGSPCGR